MSQLDFRRLVLRYVIGFCGALLLSIFSYLVAVDGWLDSRAATMALLLALATLQLIIQLVCFLHLGVRDRSAERTGTFVVTMMMMLIIVIGSIWIMRNLDYRMSTSSEDMTEYMHEQNKKGF